MITQSLRSFTRSTGKCKIVAVVEEQQHFAQALTNPQLSAIYLHHGNLFEYSTFFKRAEKRNMAVIVYIDNIDGINSDLSGLRYLVNQCHVTGIVSVYPKTLALSKNLGLDTIQRVYAVDSTGLENALESVDTQFVDILDVAPAMVVPYLIPSLPKPLPLPFIASGLINTTQQIQAVLNTGALGAAVHHPELWIDYLRTYS